MKRAVIGIRREAKNLWEARTPLTPTAIRELLPVADFVVQPCTKRVFTDAEFSSAGATVSDSLAGCDLIVGVKEVPTGESILPGKAFLLFSHTHKGQPHNMPMLSEFVKKRCRLIDYELLTDGSGKRLVAFGKFAGYAGMIDILHGVGERLLREHGLRTPFLSIPLAHNFADLSEARRAIQLAGRQLAASGGLPQELRPFTVVFTGNGNVSQGAQEMFSLLPQHEWVRPDDLQRLPADSEKLFGCVVEAHDYLQRKDSAQFKDMQDFVANPSAYVSRFARDFAPCASVLVNGIYWERGQPRLLSKQDAIPRKLISIADISCDIEGSIEATDRATTIDDPFMYKPRGADGSSVQVMSIDNLPAQLPRDASEHFSRCLKPIIEEYARGDPTHVISRATICSGGSLAPRFSRLLSPGGSPGARSRVLILGSGYVVPPALKYLQSHGVHVTVASNQDARGLSPDECVTLDAADAEQVSALVKGHDVVLSFLPATLHIRIASACIQWRRPLVTASYISPEMRALHGDAEAAGVPLLNELGLDPGLDHMEAARIIDALRRDSAQITGFTSWCGGLPAPQFASNPLGYKFSWSPRAVLLAAQNEAHYRLDGKAVSIEPSQLLHSAQRLRLAFPAFAFEGIPNRDSLRYIQLYGLPADIPTMLRGTLRYDGFCALMAQFAAFGFLDATRRVPGASSWLEAMRAAGAPLDDARFAWLGLYTEAVDRDARSMLDAFCSLLQKRLCYGPGELDMCYLQHDFTYKTSSHATGRVTSTLVQLGESGGYSAMSRTVGLPAAIACRMLLEDPGVCPPGVHAPLLPSLYAPILGELASRHGIRFREQRS